MSLLRHGLTALVTVLFLLAPSSPAHASFHLWTIVEVFSNADGSVQYIELQTSAGGQQFLAGHSITATSDGTTRSFTFPAALPGDSMNRHFIMATPGFSLLAGAVTPDYLLPCGPFFDPTASSITINFASVDSVTFTSTNIPVNGTQSMTVPGLAPAAATPENFAGATSSSFALSACLTAGTCDACDDGTFCNGAETCMGSACATTPQCAGRMCDEATDVCFDCTIAAHCDDGNPCTDDTCTAGRTCTNTPNTAACDDGLFCTASDACAGGACTGVDACPGQTCLEGVDMCGECTEASDCDDGLFCNGTETCTDSACAPGTTPCDAGDEVCNDATDACDGICGNGILQTGEACDDGDTDDGDGCDVSCAIEDGFTCDVTGEPTVCTAIPVDAGTTADAGPTGMDAGDRTDGGTDVGGSGCGCRAVGTPLGGSAWMLAIALALLWTRRRARSR